MPRDRGEASALLPSSPSGSQDHSYESGASTPRPSSPTILVNNLATVPEDTTPATPPRSPKAGVGSWAQRNGALGPVPDRQSDNVSPSRSFLDPHENQPRRRSSASVLRSRALDLDAAHGDMTKGRFWALLAVCTLSIGSH